MLGRPHAPASCPSVCLRVPFSVAVGHRRRDRRPRTLARSAPRPVPDSSAAIATYLANVRSEERPTLSGDLSLQLGIFLLPSGAAKVSFWADGRGCSIHRTNPNPLAEVFRHCLSQNCLRGSILRVTELTPKLKCLWQQAGIGQCIIRFCPLHLGPPRFSQSVKDREGEGRASVPPRRSVICALG